MKYYDVPDLPGVPPMLRDPTAPAAPLYASADSLVVSFRAYASGAISGPPGDADDIYTADNDVDSDSGSQSEASWGLFDSDGQKAIDPDTFLGLEYRSSTRISNYPLEEGAFESYNKVNDPFDVVIGLACGGSEARRTEFLATAAALAADLKLYTVVTPEQIFESVNIERYDLKRSQRNGVGLITVNLYLKEIRINTQSEFTSTPDNSPTVEQAQAATTAETTDTARAATPLDENQVKNPASASPLSQGQTQALPATADQAAPAKNAPLKLPPGYTQEEDTGLIIKPDGFVDEEMSIRVGAKKLAK